MHFLQAINSDLSVLTVCNKTGGTKKRYTYDHLNTTFPFTRRSSKIPSRFRAKMFYHFMSYLMRATCSVPLILFDFIILRVFGEE